MEKKEGIKISLTSFFFILAIIIIIIMGLIIYRFYNDKEQANIEIDKLNNKLNNFESIVNNQQRAENDNLEANSQINVSNTENIVLYNGLDISSEDLELSIPYTDENKEKYEIAYYNYENGKYFGKSNGKLEETYEGVAKVSNTKKIAISQKYDAIPRKYTVIENIPNELSEYADNNNVEIQSIDLDGDNNVEYVVAYSSFASPEDYDIPKYTNYSEILVFDSNFNKIATLVTTKDQYWEDPNGAITDEFFCGLSDVEYIDIDNDGIMEILVDRHVYEGFGVNVYKYKNGTISGNTDDALYVLP